MTYTVYKNRVHKFARVHLSTGNQPRKNGSMSRVQPPTGTYVDGLPTKEDIIQAARRTGWDVSLCKFCDP